jgi:cytochrome b6-f complex iron-sulfur subunit
MDPREEAAVPKAINSQADGAPAPGRRRFVEVLLGSGLLATAVSFLYPVLRYLVPPASADLGSNTVVAAKVGDLKPNSGKVFRFGSEPGLLILDVNSQYHAMSAVCTHLSCTVQYRPDMHEVWCACHNGVYDLNGRNVSGPPPRPLQLYDVHVQGDEIVVSRQRST